MYKNWNKSNAWVAYCSSGRKLKTRETLRYKVHQMFILLDAEKLWQC